MTTVYKIAIMILLFLGPSVRGAELQITPYSDDVYRALDSAGNNRAELEKVFTHYAASEDSLKLKAALYLVGNMGGHSYVTFDLRDTAGQEVPFSIFDYPKYDSLEAGWKLLETKYGTLDFKRKETIYDLQTIKADYLINQIDYAFRAWHEKPWAKNLPVDIFFDYVLPYRCSNEPVEPWRETFWEKYKDIASGMADSTDPMEAASLINNDVMTWFTFDPRFYYHPTDQGLSEMMKNRLGRCEDMTNAAIYAMWANGVAVTSDYTPFWANSGNNHAWNAIVLPDRKVIPFMGAESNPGKYQLANKLAKVYRKTYAQQHDNLIFQRRKQQKVPGWLAGKSYLDVTSAYTKTCDIAVTFNKPVPDSVDIAYLCVFNSGEWQAIHWGRIENGQAVFNSMGTDVAYLPALYLDEKIVPYGSPFILNNDCTTREFSPDEERSITAEFVSTTKVAQVASTDGIAKSFLTPGKEYELFYWDDGWQSVGKITAGEQPLQFENVPTDGLYWLVAKDSDDEERIFTIDDNRQVWW